MSATPLDFTFPLVEHTIGRKLRHAEKAIDVLLLHGALERAKNELDAAIHDEMRRATHAWIVAGRPTPFPQLQLTDAIREPLDQLHDLGIDEALNELDRAGYRFDEHTERLLAAPDPLPGGGYESLLNTVRRGLPGIGIRIGDELLDIDLSAASTAVIAQALLNVPGARDLASRIVSTALYSGMALTFEENRDLVSGWSWTAVLDGATCGPCAAGDGTHYDTWDDAMRDLPEGGPALVCLGGGRCRCRVVPDPA